MTLGVWMYGTLIGELTTRRGAVSFTYSDDALNQYDLGTPLLSVSMPLQAERFSGDVPFAFFNGLLPEGDAREAIAYDMKVNAADPVEMLGAIGRDCAGALVILPAGEAPADDGLPEPLDDSEVADRLRRIGLFPLGVDGKVRVSLAGMQRKLLLARVEPNWGLPVDGAPSTHIIKPPNQNPRFPQLVANQALCMRMAHHLGLSVAPIETGAFGDIPVLIVKRYDRSAPDAAGHVERLHQEDFCQAAGWDGTRHRKYEEHGGPSLRQCVETLTSWSRAPDQLERLLEVATFNVLVGNCDAHGKNLSLLHGEGGSVSLAPAYDLFSTVWYPAADTTPGMFVNDVRVIDDIGRDDLIAEGQRWGLTADAAAERVEPLLANAESALVQAANEIDAPDELVDTLLRRARTLAP